MSDVFIVFLIMALAGSINALSGWAKSYRAKQPFNPQWFFTTIGLAVVVAFFGVFFGLPPAQLDSLGLTPTIITTLTAMYGFISTKVLNVLAKFLGFS